MLSVHETAGMLGVSDARVRRLIADGLLPTVKIGRVWAVREEAAFYVAVADFFLQQSQAALVKAKVY